MGGRGGKSGAGGGSGVGPNSGPSLNQLIQQAQSADFGASNDPNSFGGYDADGNPNVIKYQGQDENKTANFLAGTSRLDLTDPQYADGYSYHDLPLNKLLLRLGANGTPTVLDDAQFNQYVNQSGAPMMYRGWSGTAAIDRFMNATHNHVGNGVMGDGYYMSPDISVAASYAKNRSTGNGEITKMALSPKARVIDRSAVLRAIRNASPKLQSSLRRAGQGGSGRTYGDNDGESQMALKMGYNVIKSGNYLVAITGDALVVSKKTL